MNPNYEEQYQKQQADYERSRNPFEYGQQVARRRYSEIMAGLDAQRQATQRTYGDMYQEARQRAVGAQAMGGPTLSGGMGQQRRDFVSAMEMQELGRIGGQRQQAEADLFAQSQAAFSNAQLEGQQATQTELQNRQAELGLVKQKQEILANNNLTDEQRAEQLAAIGAEGEEREPKTDLDRFTENAVLTGTAGTAATTAAYFIGAKAATAAGATTVGTYAAIGGGFKIMGTALIGIAPAVLGVVAFAALGAWLLTALG